MRDFDYRFEDAHGRPVHTGLITLDPLEIENAGIFEMLQAPGNISAKLGTWGLLGGLLDPAVTTFSFLEPLGHAREVKTAMSGILGRFVARAYATRYLGLTIFNHITHNGMVLSGMASGTVVKNAAGDLPDWVAVGPRVPMAIVEAKGDHDTRGPSARLRGAFEQAGRVDIYVGARRAPLKRYAIATRWGFTTSTIQRPKLWVRDPEEDGEMTKEEGVSLQVGMARQHYASMLAPLGYGELAKALVDLAHASNAELEELGRADALARIAGLARSSIEGKTDIPDGELVGGYVSRAGPMGRTSLQADELALLKELDLRPTFVGVEIGALKNAIMGIPLEYSPLEKVAIGIEGSRGRDGAGGWVIRPDDDTQIRTLS